MCSNVKSFELGLLVHPAEKYKLNVDFLLNHVCDVQPGISQQINNLLADRCMEKNTPIFFGRGPVHGTALYCRENQKNEAGHSYAWFPVSWHHLAIFSTSAASTLP